jgi:hypothetical protein
MVVCPLIKNSDYQRTRKAMLRDARWFCLHSTNLTTENCSVSSYVEVGQSYVDQQN